MYNFITNLCETYLYFNKPDEYLLNFYLEFQVQYFGCINIYLQ